jgi:hypothetical protein
VVDAEAELDACSWYLVLVGGRLRHARSAGQLQFTRLEIQVTRSYSATKKKYETSWGFMGPPKRKTR